MRTLLRDCRFALRSLGRQRGFTAIAILTLALGVGANAAILGFADSVLRRPLPFAESERVMVLWRLIDGTEDSPLSFPSIRDLRERQRVFESFATYVQDDFNITGAGATPERAVGLLVSEGFLAALGVAPVLGQGFRGRDHHPGAEATALISHRLWSERFGRDPEVVGGSVILDGRQHIVLGVLPPSLAGEQLGFYALGDIWAPLELFQDQMPQERENRPGLFAVARLKPEQTPLRGTEDVARIGREVAAEYPMTNSRSEFTAAPVLETAVGDMRPVVGALLATVAFVLLIACANLTNLLLTRTARRRREFAARSALGAGRGRLIAQALTETTVLALAGAAVGIGGAYLALAVLPTMLPEVVGVDVRLSAPVLALTVLAAVVAAGVAGSVPALEASRASFQRGLARRSSLPQKRLRSLLVIAEVGLALVLLIGAGLMLRSLARLSASDLGFEAGKVATLQLTLPLPKYDAPAWGGFYDRLLEDVRALPGVQSAAVSSNVPLVLGGGTSIVVAGDRPVPPVPEMSRTLYQSISPDLFRTLGIPLLAGRDFSSTDDDLLGGERVVILNEALARHFWPDPDHDAVGERIAFEFKGNPSNPLPQWRRVVGVVGSVRHESLSSSPEHAAYAPFRQQLLWFEGESPTMTVVLKATGDPQALFNPARDRIHAIDPEQPVYDAQTLEEAVTAQLGEPRRVASLLSAFTVLALTLSLIGVYGVVAQAVATGTREIGIRVALGARPGQVLVHYLRQSLALVGAGIALGVAASAGLSRLLESLLFEVTPLEPSIYAAAAAGLGAMAFLSTVLAARRAAGVDPVTVLRLE